MGMLGDQNNLSSQFVGRIVSALQPHPDSLERTRPLSRYGTEHPFDKALWHVDRAKEIHAKFRPKKVRPHETLAGVKAVQGAGSAHS